MEIFRNRPTGKTDLTKRNEDKEYQEIQEGTESGKVDKDSFCMAFRSISMAGKKAWMDEIPQPYKISENTGLVHY